MVFIGKSEPPPQRRYAAGLVRGVSPDFIRTSCAAHLINYKKIFRALTKLDEEKTFIPR